MTRPIMKSRIFRAPDHTWNTALTVARSRDEVLSEVLRNYLIQYIDGATDDETSGR